MSVKLYVRDNTNGEVHEYGTSQHDALILQADGSLHYENLQNGCGTIYPDEGYTFCLADGSDPRTSGDYIHYGVEPYIDIGGKEDDHTCAPCKWISVKDRLPRCGDRVIMTDGVFVCEAFLSISGKWVRNGIGWIESEITHWMPMPTPTKREKTEE